MDQASAFMAGRSIAAKTAEAAAYAFTAGRSIAAKTAEAAAYAFTAGRSRCARTVLDPVSVAMEEENSVAKTAKGSQSALITR